MQSLMDNEQLRQLPRQRWMAKSLHLPLKDWLQAKMDEATKQRLKMVGNVVIPHMAFYAINAISKL